MDYRSTPEDRLSFTAQISLTNKAQVVSGQLWRGGGLQGLAASALISIGADHRSVLDCLGLKASGSDPILRAPHTYIQHSALTVGTSIQPGLTSVQFQQLNRSPAGRIDPKAPPGLKTQRTLYERHSGPPPKRNQARTSVGEPKIKQRSAEHEVSRCVGRDSQNTS